MHAYVCMYVHVNTVAHGGQKRAPDALELEFQKAMWVLGIDLIFWKSSRGSTLLSHLSSSLFLLDKHYRFPQTPFFSL